MRWSPGVLASGGDADCEFGEDLGGATGVILFRSLGCSSTGAPLAGSRGVEFPFALGELIPFTAVKPGRLTPSIGEPLAGGGEPFLSSDMTAKSNAEQQLSKSYEWRETRGKMIR